LGVEFNSYFTLKLIMSKVIEYLKETRTELKHVVWPNRQQTIFYTVIVIVLSILIAYFLGIFDFIFLRVLKGIIAF